MPTLKLGNTSLLTLPTRITTPSIHIQKDGNHWYVPLFSGSKGAVVQSGDYNYTLGGLNVGIYRAAIGRVASKTTFTITGSCSVNISNSTYTTTSGSRTITHYVRKYDFYMKLDTDYTKISYVTTNLVRLSSYGSYEYIGSWSEETTSETTWSFPSKRDTVFAIQTATSIDGYSISNSYQNVASGGGSWSANWTMYLNGSR